MFWTIRTMVIWLYSDALGNARLLVQNEVSMLYDHGPCEGEVCLKIY